MSRHEREVIFSARWYVTGAARSAQVAFNAGEVLTTVDVEQRLNGRGARTLGTLMSTSKGRSARPLEVVSLTTFAKRP